MGNILENALAGAETVAILGHIHPDGDCIGSVLGLYNYLADNAPEKRVDVYLDHPAEKFGYLRYFDRILTEPDDDKAYSLCISLDASDRERLGDYGGVFDRAAHTLCIDHHRTNREFAEENLVRGGASSCAEVLYELLEEDCIGKETAECLYTGIIHDTGVLRYSSTSARTMEIAGILMEKGIDFTGIIDDSFYRRTYLQNRILGCALLKSRLYLDGRCIASVLSLQNIEDYGADSKDLDGIIDQLRITAGVECAVFIYEKTPGEFKVSLRSNRYLDVSRIAQSFGGGGHVRASGCTVRGGSPDEVLEEVVGMIALGMQEDGRDH
ncbi:MAG: bifunctional oligoribonuclease/PAP phosphatase NrnA [Clostridium sp.]|nr:bifunctional oligoribonuclease/PAP phosphatase NrnA [Clostridium sp.]